MAKSRQGQITQKKLYLHYFFLTQRHKATKDFSQRSSSRDVFLVVPSPQVAKASVPSNDIVITSKAYEAEEEQPPSPPDLFGSPLPQSRGGGGGCFVLTVPQGGK